MIFQDPYASLNPRQKIIDIITEPILFHNICLNRKESEEKALGILEKVGLRPEQANRYPHQFSGGQRQRIGIARALSVEPKFIIADEPVSALDVSIQAQILNLLMDLQEEFNFSYLFIAHDLSVVKHISDKIGVMYLGKIVEKGTKKDIFDNPKHPYTNILLSAVPKVTGNNLLESKPIEGEIPSPINLPRGCYFHDRCPYVKPICKETMPVEKEIESGHFVLCHLY
jgi:oligopeptide/dipeptide ABC transporter ATP-binding protein